MLWTEREGKKKGYTVIHTIHVHTVYMYILTMLIHCTCSFHYFAGHLINYESTMYMYMYMYTLQCNYIFLNGNDHAFILYMYMYCTFFNWPISRDLCFFISVSSAYMTYMYIINNNYYNKPYSHWLPR